MGTAIIIDAFIVLIIGGMGSFRGAVVGALMLGISESMGALFIPGFTKSLVYVVMVGVLLVRPQVAFWRSAIALSGDTINERPNA